MAITIELEPQEFQSANNEVIIVLDSDKKAEPKFQYIIDVNVDGVYSTRLKIQSNPQGFGIADISKHLESYVSSKLDIIDKDLFKKIEDSYVEYDITLKEEYVLTTLFNTVTDNGGFCQYNFISDHGFISEDFITIGSSTVPAYDGIQEVTSISTNSVTTTKVFSATATGDGVLSNNTTTITDSAVVFTGNKYVYNNSVKWVDVPNWDSDTYGDGSLVGDRLMLTNLPDNAIISDSERITFNIFNRTKDESKHLEVVTNNGTFRYENAFNTSGPATKFLSVGVGMFDFLHAPNPVVVSGALPVVDGNTESYTVHLTDALFVQTSKIYTFKVDSRGSQFNGAKLMYLNPQGSFSNFNFSLARTKKRKVTKKNYRKNYGSYDSVAGSYGWDSHEGGTTRLDTNIADVHTIQTDYMTEENGNLIEDLIASPIVFEVPEAVTNFPKSFLITAMMNVGGNVSITTVTPHALAVGDHVLIQGFTYENHNGRFEVIEISSTTTYTICKSYVGNVPVSFTSENSSKESFLYDGVTRLIDVKTSSVKLKNRISDKLIAYKLNFEYSNKDRVQK